MVSAERVREICRDAENVTVTGSTVAMKVGEFAQAINIDLSKEHLDQERQIKNLYMDLKAMGREQTKQIQEAYNERQV